MYTKNITEMKFEAIMWLDTEESLWKAKEERCSSFVLCFSWARKELVHIQNTTKDSYL